MEPVPASELRAKLTELERSVQAQLEECISFRKDNASRFDPRNEVTQLLNAACEKLWTEKATMDKVNFEEHASELSVLREHFRTSIENGLSDAVYREQLAIQQPPKELDSRSRRGFFGLCCSSEFPPQGGWWTEASKRLVPSYSVLRGAQLLETCLAAELVPGDILYLKSGQTAPVDGRVLAFSEGTMVDASHLTTRANDVRVCSAQSSAPTAVESRNITLRGCNIVSGSLFCMVVRNRKTPIIPIGAAMSFASDDPVDAFPVDTAVPYSLSIGVCRGVFKALCVKSHFVCKSFMVMEMIGLARTMIVVVSQALVERGAFLKLCSSLKKMGKALVFVSMDRNGTQLAQEADLEVTTFEGDAQEERMTYCSSTPKDALSRDEESSTGEQHHYVDSIGAFGGPLMVRQVTNDELGKCRSVASSVEGGRSVFVTCAAQAVLVQLCKVLRSPERPLLFASDDFRFARCLSVEADGRPARSRARPPSMTSLGDTQSTSAGASPLNPSVGGSHDGIGGVATPLPENTAESSQQLSSREREASMRSDPVVNLPNASLPHRVSDLDSLGRSSRISREQVVVSLLPVGILAEQADCVMLKPDLGLLAQSLELLDKKIPRSAR